MKIDLTVNDLIKTKYLKDICKVAAGRKGLSKPVSWVHILEIKDIVKDCVDGNELVLTTGICFTDKSIAINFLKDLIEQDVAGLCIETALYYHVIDEELISLANENNFPLIEINAISRFKDIVKGLNRMIMQGESASYEEADHYDSRLSEIESKGTLEDGIRYTADYLNLEIAYLPSIGRQFATSNESHQEMKAAAATVMKNVLSEEIYCKGKIAVKNLNIGSRNYGTLLFKSHIKDISDFDLIILGRLANRIKSDLLDEIRGNEENLYKENSWISQWLRGKLSHEEIHSHLKSLGQYSDSREYSVCTVKTDKKIMFSDFIMDMALFVRRIYEDEALFVLGYIRENLIHYIILNNDAQETTSKKMTYVAERIRQIKKSLIHYQDTVFSLGKVVKSSEALEQSYRTSLEFADEERLAGKSLILFDELYFDRILLHIADTPMVEAFVQDYLGDLLLAENFELLQTLSTYYECNCSKQKTAERLFIVRQTLYFRLQKLEEMLGDTYDEGEHKYALEFACRTYMHKEKYRRT